MTIINLRPVLRGWVAGNNFCFKVCVTWKLYILKNAVVVERAFFSCQFFLAKNFFSFSCALNSTCLDSKVALPRCLNWRKFIMTNCIWRKCSAKKKRSWPKGKGATRFPKTGRRRVRERESDRGGAGIGVAANWAWKIMMHQLVALWCTGLKA